jgi:hypothetical protein
MSFDPSLAYMIERLEPRALLSSAFVNVNISKMPGNQAEGSIVVDRADPSLLFAVSNIETGDGVLFASSADGGTTWTHRLVGDDTDGLPAACCDPSLAADAYGNLFLTYLSASTNDVIVLLSADAGQTFHELDQFHGDVDQPTITSGPGGVWLTFQKGGSVVVTGAPVSGLNQVGSFLPLTRVRGGSNGNFGDIAVAPSGQVMVTYQRQGSRSRSQLFVNVDPDGFGPAPFGKSVLVTQTHVGNFDLIPAQPNRGIDAEVGLAFDRSTDAFGGRAYMVYTDEMPGGSGNTDIFVRYSDNQGVTWSNPIRVNDDGGTTSQFFPRIAEDDTTGKVAIGWYDARNDVGPASAGDTDGKPNDDVAYFGAVITPAADGLFVSTNQKISGGVSNADDASNSIDLGDYTGLDFFAGAIHPLWFDNSNYTGDNPGGSLKTLEVYTAQVDASAFTTGTTISLGGLADPSGPVAALYFRGGANPGSVRAGASYTITISYADSAGVSLSSLDASNLLINGPNSFSTTAQFVRARLQSHGTVAVATYRLVNPSGAWTAAEGGTYTITLQPNQILDSRSRFSTSGILGTFVIATNLAGSSHNANGSGRDHDAH